MSAHTSRGGFTGRVAMACIAFIGLGVASYLTYIHYSGGQLLCTAGDPCKKVQTSTYSELAGVPVALIGLIGYLFILGSLLVRQREETRLVTLAMTTVGFGFSAYLTGRELFSIHAICIWCVSSASLMTILFLLAIWRFLSAGSASAPNAQAQLAEGEQALDDGQAGASPLDDQAPTTA